MGLFTSGLTKNFKKMSENSKGQVAWNKGKSVHNYLATKVVLKS
jgi:hypothetical protein